MKFKEVAHLYLGCNLSFDDAIGKFIGIYCIERSSHNPVIIETERAQIANRNFDQIKPILRPLSSMTEDEFISFRIICDTDFSKMVYIDNASKDGSVITRLCHTAKAQAFLLSKGFDLFNLIESGEAIDATATPTP